MKKRFAILLSTVEEQLTTLFSGFEDNFRVDEHDHCLHGYSGSYFRLHQR